MGSSTVTLVKVSVFLLSILAVASENDCSIASPHPKECICVNDTLTCSKQEEAEPNLSQISRDVRELTVTGYKIWELNTSRLLGGNWTKLEKLDLSNNMIKNVTTDSFNGRDFPVLKSLVLEKNNIYFNQPTKPSQSPVFHGLTSLLELNLRGALNESFLRTGKLSLVFNQSEFRLKKLVLSHNNITLVNLNLFAAKSMRSLEELDLSSSRIALLIADTFTDSKLPNLRVLDLSQNSLKTITKENLEDFDTLDEEETKLNLSGNPFHCSCTNTEFISWLNKTVLVLDKSSLICKNSGQPVLEYTVDPASCDIDYRTYDRFFAQYYTITITFAIIGVLAIIILFMRRKDIYRFGQQISQATKDAFDSHQTHYTYSGIQNAPRETADSGVASVDV